jgi:hypothetical protein
VLQQPPNKDDAADEPKHQSWDSERRRALSART